MVRGNVAVISVATLLLSWNLAWGQETMPSHEHAPQSEHGAMVDHGNGFEDVAVEAEMPSENFVTWLIGSLGWRYTFLLPFAALASFVLTAVLVIAGKGKTTGSAMAFIVAVPFLIGLFGMFDGLMASFMVMSTSTGVPKPSQVAMGISTSIVAPIVGMLLMVPSYLLATAGLTVRALKNDPKP